jgi:hypothetical protein
MQIAVPYAFGSKRLTQESKFYNQAGLDKQHIQGRNLRSKRPASSLFALLIVIKVKPEDEIYIVRRDSSSWQIYVG